MKQRANASPDGVEGTLIRQGAMVAARDVLGGGKKYVVGAPLQA